MTFQGLYRLKPASQRIVEPVARWLVRRRVSADAITLAGVPVGLAGGICLAAAEALPWLLLVVPLAAALRLGLNLLDGMVARESGSAHPMGEVWNEIGDRLADTFFIGGLALHPGVGPMLALGAALVAVLASYAGVTARAAGGRRQYGGVMSKPGRMGSLSAGALVTFVTGDAVWLAVAAWLILVGGALTLVERIVSARRELA